MRNDGRADTELRKIKITRDFIKYAEGSCLFEAGNTKVVCTASVEDSVPQFLRGRGKGWITAEYGMLPRSCKTRVSREATKGKQGGRTLEIQRIIGRCMRAVCDMTALGERTVWMDCDVIQADGGTRCAGVNGAFIALILALEKLRKDGLIDKIPVSRYVAAVSVGIVGGREMLDLAYDEDSSAEVDMNLAMTDNGAFIEIQGTAEGRPFSAKERDKMMSLAQKGIRDIVRKQKKILGKLISDEKE
ncbi:MAG: ribonuclease PH [Candidatus Omnitrophota bacterium]